jgi:hypothetical protein
MGLKEETINVSRIWWVTTSKIENKIWVTQMMGSDQNRFGNTFLGRL